MPIQVNLDKILADKRIKAKEIAAKIGVSETHLSLFRSGKVRGIRFSTLAKLCVALECQPGDLVTYVFDINDLSIPDDEV